MSGSSRAWSWRHAFSSSDLPAMTKHVLHTLGMFMNELGEGCYPSVADISRYSGLDKKTVLKHLSTARDAGWIAVSQHGYRGQRWKRQEYAARWPERDLLSSCQPADDDEGGGNTPPPSDAAKVVEFVPEGGGNEGSKVVEQLHQDKTSPVTTPSTSPIERGCGREDRKAEANPAPLPPEETPKSAAFEKRVMRFCSGAGFQAGKWPDWDTGTNSTLQWISGQFAKLSPEERGEAERWRCPYLLDVAARGVKPKPVGTFLRDRLWNALDPEILKRADSAKAAQEARKAKLEPDGWAACLGPVGMARLFAFLFEGPSDADLAQVPFLTDVQLAKAWPAVHGFKNLQQQKGGAVFGGRWHGFAPLFEPVPQGTDMLAAWKDEFRRRGWPWLAVFDAAKVVFCPRGGPQGLDDFEIALKGLGDDGN